MNVTLSPCGRRGTVAPERLDSGAYPVRRRDSAQCGVMLTEGMGGERESERGPAAFPSSSQIFTNL